MITILLASYNGEKYIGEQIESILNQTETRWKLIVQDDCSLDKTKEIVKRYINQYPDKIKLMENHVPSGSAKANFFSMMKYPDSEYTMICDQDDIWLPDKIQVTLKKMISIENEFGYSKPILVHTDLKIVDQNLNVIADSLFKYQNLDSSRDQLNHLLAQSIVTGCTVMVNRALLDLSAEIPEQAVMHDWWLALVAASFGAIRFLDYPTILYRQHSSNAVGAKNAEDIFYNLLRLMDGIQAKKIISETYLQAKGFLEIYRDQLKDSDLELVQQYGMLPSFRKIKRLQMIAKYNFWKNSFYRKCGQVLFA